LDTGSYSLMIDEQTAQKLGLEKTGERRIRIANGERIVCSVATLVEINWRDRQSVMRVITVPDLPSVLWSQILLGLLPMEEMDLVVYPNKHELVSAHGYAIEYMAY
jgi:predicted aspartyl protease